MKRSKLGVTLVELVICCGIIVMLGGACTALLMSGHNVFTTGAKAAHSQMDADVFQTFMMNIIPSASAVEQISLENAKGLVEGDCVYMENGKMVVSVAGKKTEITGIADMTYAVVPAGASNSLTARAQFTYTVTLDDGNQFSTGFVLSNIKYVKESMITITGSVKEKPIAFSIPAPEESVPDASAGATEAAAE